MQKWTRNYILRVQTGDGTYIEITPPLTLNFKVSRSTGSEANTAKLTIFNLAEKTRLRIYKDQYDIKIYKGVELYAGYGTQRKTLPLIFKGNIKRAYSHRQGTEYLTEIECYDGGFAILNGTTSRTFAGGTSDRQIITDLFKDLPGITKGAIGKFSGALPRGNAMSGSSAELLKTAADGGFFIDCEKAYALKDNECISGPLAEISARTGLLGTPMREETKLTVETIFEPRLMLGQKVRLKSLTESIYNGDYKVLGIEHSGTISESAGGECKTKATLYFGTATLETV